MADPFDDVRTPPATTPQPAPTPEPQQAEATASTPAPRAKPRPKAHANTEADLREWLATTQAERDHLVRQVDVLRAERERLAKALVAVTDLQATPPTTPPAETTAAPPSPDDKFAPPPATRRSLVDWLRGR